jgi:signal transduction histidine kinase
MVATVAGVGQAFWYPLRREANSQTKRITDTLARRMQADILDEVRHQTHAQARFASLLSLEPTLSEEGWESQAKLFMSHHPGYVALQWVDASYSVRRQIAELGNQVYSGGHAAGTAPLRQVLEGQVNRCQMGVAFAPEFRLGNGHPGREVIAPICRGQQLLGFLIAVLDEPRVLAEILADDTNLGYGISILEGKQEIFRTPDSSSENEQRWGEDADVPLSGADWRVRVWPESAMLHKIESRLPERAYLMGSLIGLLLFTTLDFAQGSYYRSRELRQVHKELESRVEQRTTELRLANRELEGEIHERRRAEESLQELSGRLLHLRDEEQRRIARELHDGTVQTLGALAIDLEKALQGLSSEGSQTVRKLLANSCELVERVTTELRTMSYLLHPPMLDDLGLEDVLPWYAAGFGSRSGISVSVDVQANLGRLPREHELTLFRIVQEGLTNIHRHSGSSTAKITLLRDAHKAMLKVSDRGRGFPPGGLERGGNAGVVIGVGVAGMRERARQLGGQLQIESGPSGTSLTATLPILGRTAVSEQNSERADADSARAVSKENRS